MTPDFVAPHESGYGAKRQFARCKVMSGSWGKADLPVAHPGFSV
jgi:hypothetical protein